MSDEAPAGAGRVILAIAIERGPVATHIPAAAGSGETGRCAPPQSHVSALSRPDVRYGSEPGLSGGPQSRALLSLLGVLQVSMYSVA